MQITYGIFKFRWFLWGLGFFYLLSWIPGWVPNFWSHYLKVFRGVVERHFIKILLLFSAFFFFFAALEKYSQFVSLSLNAQDFWLFVDILEQMKKGGLFLTRFAPQDIGFVQHGIIHPMITWCILLPFVFLFGAVPVALMAGPAALSGAGFLLGVLTRRDWGTWGAFFWMLAFYSSTQVGKVLLYDVHPEVMYPVCIFLWFWAMGLGGSDGGQPRVRWVTLGISTFLAMGVKEDSFLILGPWICWSFFDLKGEQKKAAGLSAVIALGVVLFQMRLVQDWSLGLLGPIHWQGLIVSKKVSLGLLSGQHWSHPLDVGRIFIQVVSDAGGWIHFVQKGVSFWVSRPWLSLLILAPWVVTSARFWWVAVPLSIVYSLFDARHLWNYYSAPFLASFWACAACMGSKLKWKRSRFFPVWALGASLLLGSSSVQIFIPLPLVWQIRKETQNLLPCLGTRGWVSSQLLGLVPLSRVLTDRIPNTEIFWNDIDFALLSPTPDKFEFFYQELVQKRKWRWVGEGCQALSLVDLKKGQQVVLFVK